ncbi:MAG: DoxX family protein [Candidatus Binatia bacterium]|nr:DoxX family protein [Candidatus Binatia bacterium]
MQFSTLCVALQSLVGLGLLNVWIVRARSSTAYRGGDALSLREEFAAYGLPEWFFYLVGFLKVGSALALLIGIWVTPLVLPGASVVAGLMVGALVMHAKVGDPWVKSAPAFLMLLMSCAILALS